MEEEEEECNNEKGRVIEGERELMISPADKNTRTNNRAREGGRERGATGREAYGIKRYEFCEK